MKKSAEFKKFDDAVKRILSVPKSELKQREEDWKRKQMKKKRAVSSPASPDLAAGRPVSG
jgi:hypothetical protein